MRAFEILILPIRSNPSISGASHLATKQILWEHGTVSLDVQEAHPIQKVEYSKSKLTKLRSSFMALERFEKTQEVVWGSMAEPLYSAVEALQKSPPKEIIVVITAVTIGICCALSWYRRKYIDTHEKHCQVRSFWHPFEACRGPSEHYINYTLFELLSILSQVLQCFTTVCLPGSTVIQTHNGQGVLEDLLAAFKKRDSQWLLSGIPCVNGVWDFKFLHCPRFYWQQKFVQQNANKNQRMSYFVMYSQNCS